MADLEKLQKSLEAEGFAVSRFDTAAQAADYLDAALDGKTIGIGGSITVQEMGLGERLAKHNTVLWHWAGSTTQEAAGAQVYLTSVNGAAETGELINIDGTGNRVASGLFGHEKVYFIVGRSRLRRRPLAGPEYRRPQERPAAGPQDPLRRQGRPLLQLQEPRADLPGPGGVLGEAQQHGHGSGAGG